MAAVMIERDEADVALEAWARWAKSALTSLGFPPISIIGKIVELGIRGAAQSAGLKVMEIDEVCELTERAVTTLPGDEKEAVIRHYLLPEPDFVSARIMRIASSTFSEKLKSGKGKIQRYIEDARLSYAAG